MADGEALDETVRDVPERHRYELATPDGPAIAAYERVEDRLILSHTVVPSTQEGQGLASRLIAGVLSDVRAQGLRIVPSCPFVATYVAKHPEERDLVAD